MTRKDYEALAAAIREEYDGFAGFPRQQFALQSVASRIADALYEDNPRFNREKFLFVALGEED